MPRFLLTQKEFLKILSHYSFAPKGKAIGSHQTWEGFYNRKRRCVTVDLHYKEYSGLVLQSMIAQSGIPKKVFRVFRNTKKIIDI